MTNTPANPAERLLFEISKPGRRCVTFPALDVPEVDPVDALKGAKLRSEPARLPEVGELDLTAVPEGDVGLRD